MRRVTIEPVTRIEGAARITLALGRDGRVRDARVEVLELRGFEAICVGRPIREMPALTARICGICPVSHSLVAAKAGDELLGAAPPPAARMLRSVALLASVVQSHATSFFYLSAPDFVFGHDSSPELHNPFALAEAAPELARDGVALRRFGQSALEKLAGRRVHPAFAVPGGVTRALDPAARDELLASVPAALATAERSLAWWNARAARWMDENPSCAGPDTAFLAHAGEGGALAFEGDRLRLATARGDFGAEFSAAECLQFVRERSVPWSYAKLCGWQARRGGARAYQVGPLARRHVAIRCGTPRADRALRWRSVGAGRELFSFDAHGARLVEVVHAIERIGELLATDGITSPEVLAPPGALRDEAVASCEAPRGALFHGYRVDAQGLVTAATVVAPTGQNARAMNAAVRRVARDAIGGDRITASARNRIAAALRAFDPCLSCATHAAGGIAELRLVGPDGEVVDEWPRD